jgi:adenylate kinase
LSANHAHLMNLILFGPPGVGKGTQAERLTERYRLTHISTGDLLRRAIREGTALGKVAKQHVESGGLVPDEVIIGLMGEILKQHPSDFLLDGFPRTVEQARALDQLFRELGIREFSIVMLDAPEDELVRRMLKRGVETGRTDDTEDTIRTRFKVYQEQTAPVKSYYQSTRQIEMVDGLGSVDEVTDRIVEALGTTAKA